MDGHHELTGRAATLHHRALDPFAGRADRHPARVEDHTPRGHPNLPALAHQSTVQYRVLPEALDAAGISYVQMAALGGRRGKSKSVGESVNAGWKVQAFRNYADYAETPPFRAGLGALLEMASEETCAIMCSEAVWWRCHRRIVTDHVLVHGVPVIHLFSAEKGEPASLTPFANVSPRFCLSYPAP
jgi:hypothetical protein